MSKFDQYYLKNARSSFCSTTVYGGAKGELSAVLIRFRGPAAHFPSLKNQKVRGTNILRGEAKARLTVVSDLVAKSLDYQVPRFPPNVPLFLLVMCAYRGHSFDEDNVLTTIKDWLEPQWIRNHDRGWGVGLIENDKDVNGFAVKKGKDDAEAHTTDILLCQLADVLEARKIFIEAVYRNSIDRKV